MLYLQLGRGSSKEKSQYEKEGAAEIPSWAWMCIFERREESFMVEQSQVEQAVNYSKRLENQ